MDPQIRSGPACRLLQQSFLGRFSGEWEEARLPFRIAWDFSKYAIDDIS